MQHWIHYYFQDCREVLNIEEYNQWSQYHLQKRLYGNQIIEVLFIGEIITMKIMTQRDDFFDEEDFYLFDFRRDAFWR